MLKNLVDRIILKNSLLSIFITLGIFILCGCNENIKYYQHYDSVTKLQENEYKELLKSSSDTHQKNLNLITKKSAQELPVRLSDQRISLTFTNSIPITEILLTLSKQTGTDMIISPDIEGSLIVNAHQKPFNQILEQICQDAHLRYRHKDGILHIEPDTPYIKNYNIQFMVMHRKNQNRVSVATDVFAVSEGVNIDSDNGSSTLLSADSESDFWEELYNNLELLLGFQDPSLQEMDGTRFTLHKQAGLITIFANETQHKQIEKYLEILRKNTATQVLIEAKILEINLKEEFKSGINWNSLKGNFVIQSPLGRLITPGPFNSEKIPTRDVFTLGGSGHHLTGIVSFLEKFGTVRTLSSPRLTVLNNQSAILKVATNSVFFRIDYDRDFGYDNKREHVHVSSEIQTVPIGLVMVVHPAINLENGRIILTLRPTISRIVGEKEDPAVAIVSKQEQQSLIPQVQIREMDSVISMNSGEIVVMGGLMEERSDNEKSSIPFMSDFPVIGNLFKAKSSEHSVTELIIFLKATILDDTEDHLFYLEAPLVSQKDKKLYDSFGNDPRRSEFNP